MGGQFEVKDGATKKYYSIAGMMVAVHDGTGLQYLLTDHLGSTVAVTNQSGTLTSQQRYLPFGAARTIPNSPILGTDFTYTGQRKLDDGMGGVMDYKARFYSPALGRFQQPDTIIPNAANPQSWNRFSYVRNNPILFNDPTGHMESCEDGDLCRHPDPVPGNGGGGSGDEGNDRDDKDNDPNLARQDRLFSYMFSGSGKDGAWTYLDWQYYYSHRDGLWNGTEQWLNPEEVAGWDLFALHVERLASHYSADEHEQFVRDFSLVFAGLSTTVPWWVTAMDAKDGAGEYSYLHEGNEGLAEKYMDSLHLGENASHHYAGLFFLGYFTNGHLAASVNIARDADWWNGEFNGGDLLLGDVAAYDGGNLGNPHGQASLTDVSGWIDELSP